jgi:hypothetical protein
MVTHFMPEALRLQSTHERLKNFLDRDSIATVGVEKLVTRMIGSINQRFQFARVGQCVTITDRVTGDARRKGTLVAIRLSFSGMG